VIGGGGALAAHFARQRGDLAGRGAAVNDRTQADR
jgi:hypothetical protein